MHHQRFVTEPGEAELLRDSGARELDRTAPSALIRRDLIRWGPIVAGLLTVLTTLIVLSALGLAVGLSAVQPDDTGVLNIGTGAWIWGIASGVIAFFLGGLVAAATAAVGGRSKGLINGTMVGVAAIAATVLLISLGASALLGPAATALGELTTVGQLQVGQASDQALNAFARAESSAWYTFIGLVVALACAAAGGLLGARGQASDAPERG